MKLSVVVLGLTASLVSAAPNIAPRALQDDAAPHQNDPKFISEVMRAHWYWRRMHCAQDLVWDSRLADAARADVETCTAEPQHHRAGSNLSSVKPAPSSTTDWIEFARDASHGWASEGSKYPYEDPHYDAAWGHFTQMVWRNSTRIGCALGHCSDSLSWPGRFYCYYEFFGNNVYPGQFQAQVWGPVCGDPNDADMQKRESLEFDWARE